jgi:hypothetical protein
LGVAEYHQNPWHVILVCMFWNSHRS